MKESLNWFLDKWVQKPDVENIVNLNMGVNGKNFELCFVATNSSVRTKSSEAKYKEAVANLELNRLREKQDIEKQKQKLKHKEELMDVQDKVQLAQLESELCNEQIDSEIKGECVSLSDEDR